MQDSTMIKRKSRQRPEDRPVVVLSQSDAGTTPSKGSNYGKGRPRRGRDGARLAIVLLLFCFAALLLTRMRGRRSSPVAAAHGAKEDGRREKVRFPDGWEEFSYNDIRRHFNCKARSKDDSKPLPTLEDWDFMRRTFTEVVDGEKKWDDPVPPTLGYSLEKGVPVPPPYFPKASPGKGRGLFASRFIEEGELVHDGSHSDVVFPDALAWRRFVFSLDRDLACDCTDWHWMQRLEKGGKYFMLGGINISSLMNSGGKEFGPGRSPNALPESEYSGRFYATRDIERFEEILTDYDSYYTNWEEVGL